jgi:hypothetical protein
VATGKDMNQVFERFEACAAESIEWANRQYLQFNTAKTEAALRTGRKVHKNQLHPKLRGKIKFGNAYV